MSIVPSLLQAVIHVDGEALVMHAGEKPYVVSPTGQTDLASRGLSLEAVNGIVNQLLPTDFQSALDEFGAVQYELPAPEFPGEHFTVVAARGGDDVWVEVRRRRVPDVDAVPEEMFAPPAEAPPPAPPVVAMPAPPPPVAADHYAVVSPSTGASHWGDRVRTESVPASTVRELHGRPEPDRGTTVSGLPEQHVDEWGAGAPEVERDEPQEEETFDAIDRTGDEDLTLPDATQLWGVTSTEPPELESAPTMSIVERPAMIQVEEPALSDVGETEEFVVDLDEPTPYEEPAESEPEYTPPPSVSQVVRDTRPLPEPEAPRPPVAAAPPMPPPAAAALPKPPPAAETRPEPSPVAATPTEPPRAVAEQPKPAPVAEAPPKPSPPAATPPEPKRAAVTPPEPPRTAAAPPPPSPPPEVHEQPAPPPPPPPQPSRPAPPQPAVVLPISRSPIRFEAPPPPVVEPDMFGLERLLRLSAARGASTLYLSSDARPSVRVDGELHALDGEPELTARDVESLLLTLMPERNHEALRTGAATEWIVDIEDAGRVRCMSFRDHHGPGGVFRLMPMRSVSVDQLGLPRSIQGLAIEPEGLVLVAGPRSSGKRTLIAAYIDVINRSRSDHVISIEREINIVHDRGRSFISQREVRGDDDDMVVAARAALREDPDVLVIEDLRTGALMNVAFEAAASGHLVIGGFSAHTATAAIDRIIDLYAPEYRRQVQLALADNLRGVIVQVLLRRTGGGRVAARELLLNTPAVASVLAEGKTSQLPMAIEGGRRHGMVPLNDSLVAFVQSGAVDSREAYRYSSDRPGFLALLKRQGLDTSFVERLA